MKTKLALITTLAALVLSQTSGLQAADAPAPAAATPAPAAASPSPAASPAALDFGDFKSSTLVGNAWKASADKNYDAVIAYTGKCIEMFQKQALEQQKSLTEPVPGADKEKVFAQWALNDVGTAYFIRGQAFEKTGKTKEAIEAYKFLADNLAFAQTYDPKGWFWKPAGAAAERIKVLDFDSAQ
jgi:tetratricopeptide (TPR) repeat protein